jgi:hypothetical protein
MLLLIFQVLTCDFEAAEQGNAETDRLQAIRTEGLHHSPA